MWKRIAVFLAVLCTASTGTVVLAQSGLNSVVSEPGIPRPAAYSTYTYPHSLGAVPSAQWIWDGTGTTADCNMNITVYEDFTIKCLNEPMTIYIAADNYYTATMLNITGSGNNWAASEVYVVPTTGIPCGTNITLTMKAYNSPSPGQINCQNNPGALIYAVTTNDCPCTTVGTVYSSLSCGCQSCRSLMQGCTVCSSATVCTSCDSASNFQLSSGNCVCPLGYAYAASSGTCQSCRSLMQGCTVCSSATVCTSCDSASNFQLSSGNCVCPLGYAYAASSGTCQSCRSLMQGCTVCSSATVCTSCDSASNFQLSSGNCVCPLGYAYAASSGTCQSCRSLMQGCTVCSSATVCTSCDSASNFQLSSGNCVCPLGYAYAASSGTCQSCRSLMQGCTVCSSATVCTSCDSASNFQLSSGNCVCPLGYAYAASSGTCQSCRSLMQGCTVCSSATVCTSCDSASNFQLSSGNCVCPLGYAYAASSDICLTVCGDGYVRGSETCDDGNLAPKDGCDQFCQIQPNYTCTNSYDLSSNCSYNQPIQASILTITSTPNHNSFTLTANIGIHFPGISSLNFSSLISTNIPLNITGYTISSNGELSISFSYSEDMQGKLLTLTFNPALSNGDYWGVPASIASCINLTSSNNSPLLYLDDSQQDQQRTITTMLQTAQFVSYGVLVLGLLCDKVIGIELFGVWQTIFFAISTIYKVPPILAPLLKLRTVNGINTFTESSSESLPQSIVAISYFPAFIANCNYTVWLVIADIVVGLLLLATAEQCSSSTQSVKRIGKRLLKEYFVMLVAFNTFNICYSAGLQIRYGSALDALSIASVVVCLCMLAGAISLPKLNHEPQYLGEFYSDFRKKDCFSSGFISTTIAYRCLLGFSLGAFNEIEEATIFSFMLGLLFSTYLLADLPFKRGWQNWRSCLVQICGLTGLFVAMYYRSMKSTTPVIVRAKILWPSYLVIVALILSTAVSVIAISYELYQKWRAICVVNKVRELGQQTESRFEMPSRPSEFITMEADHSPNTKTSQRLNPSATLPSEKR